jgi:uncharacterized membrane protein YfcA
VEPILRVVVPSRSAGSIAHTREKLLAVVLVVLAVPAAFTAGWVAGEVDADFVSTAVIGFVIAAGLLGTALTAVPGLRWARRRRWIGAALLTAAVGVVGVAGNAALLHVPWVG